MTELLNPLFAEATTSAAFSLVLRGDMVQTLAEVVAAADAGVSFKAAYSVRSMQGLIRRGLVVQSMDQRHWRPGQPFAAKYEPTMAGRLVHALTQQAGLQPGGCNDPLIDEMRRLQGLRAEAERMANAEQERRHREFIASIKPKERT